MRISRPKSGREPTRQSLLSQEGRRRHRHRHQNCHQRYLFRQNPSRNMAIQTATATIPHPTDPSHPSSSASRRALPSKHSHASSPACPPRRSSRSCRMVWGCTTSSVRPFGPILPRGHSSSSGRPHMESARPGIEGMSSTCRLWDREISSGVSCLTLEQKSTWRSGYGASRYRITRSCHHRLHRHSLSLLPRQASRPIIPISMKR